jgi:hypothetical protein
MDQSNTNDKDRIYDAVPLVQAENVIPVDSEERARAGGGGGGGGIGYGSSQQTFVQGVPINSNVVIVREVVDGSLPSFPILVTCPNCNRNVTTVVDTTPGPGTWCGSAMLCIFFWPLFWLPFCVPEMQDQYHFCPACGAQIGTRRIM